MSNFKIYSDSVNYTATVIKLPIKQKIENLDNLVKVTVFGNDCLISKNSDENELYLFFPSGTQLSEKFLKGNNLYRDNQLNIDTNQKGFFEVNGRVKAIKFKQIISAGFIISIDSLKNLWEHDIYKDYHYSDICRLEEGMEFNEFFGIEVCKKYMIKQEITPGVKKDRISKINDKLSSLLIPNQFRFHSDTQHLAKNLHEIHPEDIITITDKWHGSSCILSEVLIHKKLTLYQKLLNLIGGKIPIKDYGYIYSSGKPKSNLPKGIVGNWVNNNGNFYTSNIWERAFNDYKYALNPGISIYGELVGFEENGSAIQKGYDYKCSPNTEMGDMYRFVVYRITYTKPDGNIIEFTWSQMIEYCSLYGLETVKLIYFGSAGDFVKEYTDQNFQEIFFNKVQNLVESVGNCVYCMNSVPSEGVVIRKDGGKAFKLKSKLFLKNESDSLDKGEINIEDIN